MKTAGGLNFCVDGMQAVINYGELRLVKQLIKCSSKHRYQSTATWSSCGLQIISIMLFGSWYTQALTGVR